MPAKIQFCKRKLSTKEKNSLKPAQNIYYLVSHRDNGTLDQIKNDNNLCFLNLHVVSINAIYESKYQKKNLYIKKSKNIGSRVAG